DEVTDNLNKIAIIGTDRNIYTYDFDDSEITQLTNDERNSRSYQWVTWSTDGRLAYFCCENNPQGQAYVSDNGTETPRLIYTSPDTFFIYAYWSPADCGYNCRELAMLVQRSTGLAVDVLTDSDEPSFTTIGTGQPFYYHWDSTGSQMIFHRGNRDLDIYSRAENDVSTSLAPSSGSFQAPVWSPIDNRVLVGVQGSSAGLTTLTVLDGTDELAIANDIEGLVSFLWSPDGSKIAYRTVDQFGYNAIVVIDAQTGEILDVADNRGAIAFSWSPDSSKIAYLTVEDGSDSASITTRINQSFVQNNSPTYLTWNVLDIEAQTNVSYSSFIPTYEMVYLLTYFDQFAPSHRLWSPDSRYLVFAGGIADDQTVPMIYTLDTQANDASVTEIAEGTFGIWSFK
ncbi:MAG: hypothetical protein AAFV93_10435, partial [Chloroflexota bacterium]